MKTEFVPNKNLEAALSKKFTAALSNAGEVLLSQVKRNAPVDTGALKNSLKIDKSKIDSHEIEIEAGVDYSKFVEYGVMNQAANPFMRSALVESRSKVLKKFKGII